MMALTHSFLIKELILINKCECPHNPLIEDYTEIF
jgi:hypothetical protein